MTQPPATINDNDSDESLIDHHLGRPSSEEIQAFINEGLPDGESWFYWHIKAAGKDSFSNWEWPPCLSGRISARNKKEARLKLNEEHQRELPLQVRAQNRASEPFLLHLEEIILGTPSDRYIERFMPKKCSICGASYTLIGHYNDPLSSEVGCRHTCSRACRDIYQLNKRTTGIRDGYSGHDAVIYCITHKPSQQKYIGKTTQAFTLRWYQHMYQPGTTAFHDLIKKSSPEDWTFEVLEVADQQIPKTLRRGTAEYNQAVLSREQYWINHFDTINNGLNTATSILLDSK